MKDRAELDQLNKELAALNQAVDDALAARTAWMDAHMPDYAEIQVGEEIFNSEGRKGVVTGHYRYWAHQNVLYDRSMHIDYRYSKSSGWEDNTSSQPVFFPRTREAFIKEREAELKHLIGGFK